MNEPILGTTHWAMIRQEIAKSSQEEAIAWWEDNRKDLTEVGADYVRAALVHGRASDEAIRAVSAHDKRFRSLWLAYRTATTEQLKDIQDRQARLLSSIRSASDVAITIAKAAVSAVIGL